MRMRRFHSSRTAVQAILWPKNYPAPSSRAHKPWRPLDRVLAAAGLRNVSELFMRDVAAQCSDMAARPGILVAA
jgi:hypothetical protein